MNTKLVCPQCKIPLIYYGDDDGPDYMYCPMCMDTAYDPELGAEEIIGEFT